MNTLNTVVKYELSEFLAGRHDNTFHSLIEAGADIQTLELPGAATLGLCQTTK